MSSSEVMADAPAAESGSVDRGRRYFLIGATSAVAGVGVVGAAVPFVKYWEPSAKARALGAPVKIDISKLAPGELLSPIPAWRGKPIFVLYRDETAVKALEETIEEEIDYSSLKNLIAFKKNRFNLLSLLKDWEKMCHC